MRHIWLLIVILAIQSPQIRGYAAIFEAIEHIQIHQNEMLDSDHKGIDPEEEHVHKHSHDSDNTEHEHSHSHAPLSVASIDSQFLFPAMLPSWNLKDLKSNLTGTSKNLKLEQFVFEIFRPPIA